MLATAVVEPPIRRGAEVRLAQVVEYQEWQRWVDGSPVRRYCWIGESGEIRFDEGEPVSAEGNLLRATNLDGDRDAFDIADEE